MGVHSGQPDHARHCHEPGRRDDPGETARNRGGRRSYSAPAAIRLLLILILCGIALAARPTQLPAKDAFSNALRIAVYNVNLSRRGPGLLLRDLLADDPGAQRLAQVISQTAPDILVLTKIDHDMDLHALTAFAALISSAGHDMPHAFARRPNSGWATGRDMDGDGTLGTADDAHGFGAFAGVGGMAVLSRLPILHDQAEDFSTLLWADLPGHSMPLRTPAPAMQRLSTTGHWRVPIQSPAGGVLNLLVFYTSPPVFGSVENRNLHRNHDEVRFWTQYLDGRLPMQPPDGPVVVAGSANLDPADGDGMHMAMQGLLSHPRLQDPEPRSIGAILAADHPVSLGHRGDPALDTTEWLREIGPGNLRVDYVLPDARLQVLDAGVVWPPPGSALADLVGTGENAPTRHRLVWVDLEFP